MAGSAIRWEPRENDFIAPPMGSLVYQGVVLPGVRQHYLMKLLLDVFEIGNKLGVLARNATSDKVDVDFCQPIGHPKGCL